MEAWAENLLAVAVGWITRGSPKADVTLTAEHAAQLLAAYKEAAQLRDENERLRRADPNDRFAAYRDALETWLLWWHATGKENYAGQVLPPLKRTGDALSCIGCAGIRLPEGERCRACGRLGMIGPNETRSIYPNRIEDVQRVRAANAALVRVARSADSVLVHYPPPYMPGSAFDALRSALASLPPGTLEEK